MLTRKRNKWISLILAISLLLGIPDAFVMGAYALDDPDQWVSTEPTVTEQETAAPQETQPPQQTQLPPPTQVLEPDQQPQWQEPPQQSEPQPTAPQQDEPVQIIPEQSAAPCMRTQGPSRKRCCSAPTREITISSMTTETVRCIPVWRKKQRVMPV